MVFRMKRQLKDKLESLAELGERSQAWVMAQAADGLFGDLERNVIRPHELEAEDPGPGKRGGEVCFTWPGHAYHRKRLADLTRTHGVAASVVQRAALHRYIAKRKHLLSGERQLQDDLRESGPVLPP